MGIFLYKEEIVEIESFGSDWEKINKGILDNRNENSFFNNINLKIKNNLNYPLDFFVFFNK